VDEEFEPASAAGPAPLERVKQSVHSDLQYVSLQVDGRTFGGWYRVLPDGQMELLALANMHCERRFESTPTEQARGMLADFIRAARPKAKTNGSAADSANTGLNVAADGDRGDAATATLGDLLYADRARARVSEKDWVGLVQSTAAGDQLALHRLFERTHRVVFTLIMRLTNNRETAEELTLDVFHDVWRGAPTYDAAGGSVLGWILNQARSRAINQLVFEQGKRRVDRRADRPLPLKAASGCDEVFDPREKGHLLRNALMALTADERQAIETAFFSKLACAEVAARLHQPLGTVKTSIRSGLGKLRQALATGAKEP
jgi:RNA polymerase sigma-70 factor (ECF subfamily)